MSEENQKRKKTKGDFDLGEVEALPIPNRTLPNLIEDLLIKGFEVHLSPKGYYVGGFYGLEVDGKKGFAFASDSSLAHALVFYDNKGTPNLIKSFEDLVKFNRNIWAVYWKQDEYKKPDMGWFPHLMEHNLLSLSPK